MRLTFSHIEKFSGLINLKKNYTGCSQGRSNIEISKLKAKQPYMNYKWNAKEKKYLKMQCASYELSTAKLIYPSVS